MAHIIKGSCPVVYSLHCDLEQTQASETGLVTFLKCVFCIILDLLKF